MTSIAQPFNTIEYCRQNAVPCFTFPMTHDKRCKEPWKTITAADADRVLHPTLHNGFAIITGHTHWLLDLDMKHAPNPVLDAALDFLMDRCSAIEKTPGGYHFWYRMDARVEALKTATEIAWDGEKQEGMDARVKGGIGYCAPTRYQAQDGGWKQYDWLFGTLADAEVVPDDVWERLAPRPVAAAAPVTPIAPIVEAPAEADPIPLLLRSLAPARCDDYHTWVQVGMILKQEGYPLTLWDEWSKQSASYTLGACAAKWRSFGPSDRPLTRRTLYHWVKADDPAVFYRLTAGDRSPIITDLMANTHGTIAEAFHALNPNRFLYSTESGWYILTPHQTWKETGQRDVLSLPGIMNIVRDECAAPLMQWIDRLKQEDRLTDTLHTAIKAVLRNLNSAGFLKGVTAFFTGYYHQADVDRRWNAARHLFAFENGVMDLRDGSFRPIEPDDYITVTCGYPYRPAETAEKEQVREFLAKIWPNAAVLRYNLVALSRSLSGENTDQVFHVFTGTGANGKSCLMDLCTIVFGDYYRTFSVSYLTKESDGKDRPLPELAAAQYARMLVTSEPDDRDRFQVSLLKNMTGNEEVTFRGMYAKVVTRYVPQFKLWVLTNDVPRLSKWDQAIERRMRCVHFPTRFCYEPKAENESLRDDTLPTRFREDPSWRYGLLGLLLDAYLANRGSLTMPPEVAEFTEEYLLANNPVGSWLKTYYERTGRREDAVQRTELHKQFRADTNAHITQSAFGLELIKCKVDHKAINGKHYYYGIVRKLAVAEEDEKEDA